MSPTTSPTPTTSPDGAGGGDTDSSPTPSPVLSPIAGTDEEPATGGQSPTPAPELSPITGGPIDQPTQQSPLPAAGGDEAPAESDEQPAGEQITGTTEDQPATGRSALPFTGLPALGILSAALTLLLVGGAVTYAARRREDRALLAG